MSRTVSKTDDSVSRLPVIAITCGEPAGIGPEIAVRTAWEVRHRTRCVLVGDAGLLRSAAAAIDGKIDLCAYDDGSAEAGGNDTLPVIHVPLAVPVEPGKLDPRNGLHVLKLLDLAIEGASHGRFDAIVTAPLQKSAINDAGVPFTGHTEYLAEKTGTPRVVMMLAGGKNDSFMRVALATTHLPLKDVAAAITFDSLKETLEIVHSDLKIKFGIGSPRILVAGLNPHAGEGGYLGREEIDVITPVVESCRTAGMDLLGPLPADTLFQPKYLNDADCVLAMYHDQGLPVLKFASFGHGVNITLGLPIIRTSVDHGTALDLAAKGVGHADCGSMMEAVKVAAYMAAASKA
ncbi:MAG: pdxA [Paucimonas sp.]|jgi:4-hydroxythreonine-4-phosphate dehydrogenase|nr:pdxA [Paucimonas sp.]